MRNIFNTWTCSAGNIIERQLERLTSVQKSTALPEELCLLISGYEITIDTQDANIGDKYLPELIVKLKALQDMLKYKASVAIRMQEQLTKEVIAICKHHQVARRENRKEQEKLALNNRPMQEMFGESTRLLTRWR